MDQADRQIATPCLHITACTSNPDTWDVLVEIAVTVTWDSQKLVVLRLQRLVELLPFSETHVLRCACVDREYKQPSSPPSTGPFIWGAMRSTLRTYTATMDMWQIPSSRLQPPSQTTEQE